MGTRARSLLPEHLRVAATGLTLRPATPTQQTRPVEPAPARTTSGVPA